MKNLFYLCSRFRPKIFRAVKKQANFERLFNQDVVQENGSMLYI